MPYASIHAVCIRTLLKPQNLQRLIVYEVLAIPAVDIALSRFHGKAVRLRLKVQIAIPFRHDIRTLQTQIQRPQADHVQNTSIFCLIIRLRDYARFLVDIRKDGSIVVDGLFARVLEHFPHMLCRGVSIFFF
jgi:hypothetical protein